MLIKNKQNIKQQLNISKKYQVVVCLTSWKKRITLLEPTLKSICSQEHIPDIFYIILSKKEFPNMDNDLPDYIHEYQLKYNFIKIEWVDNNIKQFKKNLPILKKYWGRDDILLFTTDDDMCYKQNYISDLYNLVSTLPENTVITYNYGWPLENPEVFEKNNRRVIGKFEVLVPSFFDNKIVLDINEKDINTKNWISEDWWISYNLRQNKKLQWYFLDYLFLFDRIEFIKENEIKPLETIWGKVDDTTRFNNVVKLYNKKLINNV